MRLKWGARWDLVRSFLDEKGFSMVLALDPCLWLIFGMDVHRKENSFSKIHLFLSL